jgi:hypothetical protein
LKVINTLDEQVNPFRYIKASAYLIFILAVLLGGFMLLSLIRLDRQEETRHANPTTIPFLACNFTNTGAEDIPLYNVPYADALFVNFHVPKGVPYDVRSINTVTDFIELDVNGISGYVDPFSGIATGECDSRYIPRDSTPLSDYPMACAFMVQQDTHLYHDAALTDVHRLITAGEVLTILRTHESSYYGVMANGFVGWVAQAEGTQRGACGMLPHAEGE